MADMEKFGPRQPCPSCLYLKGASFLLATCFLVGCSAADSTATRLNGALAGATTTRVVNTGAFLQASSIRSTTSSTGPARYSGP